MMPPSCFVNKYRQQRQAVLILPDLMLDKTRVAGLLASLFAVQPGMAALENGLLVG